MAWRPPGPIQGTTRYDDFGVQSGMQRPLGPAPVNDVFLNAGSEFIKSGFGAYLGTGKEYVQSNVSRLFLGHDLAYYFQVNDVYVKNKLKVLFFPFRHKGNWTRIAEQVAGGLKYKPPKYDINAPDLYIPLMAFASYIVLCGYASGLLGKEFSPAVINRSFSTALMGWAAEALLLRCLLFAMSSGDVPVLDIIAYSGYAFVGVSLCILATIKSYLYYTILLWTGLCMAIFLVKTMKRILFADARAFDRDSSKHHYLLLFMAASQWPLFFWLSYINSSKA